MRAAATSPAQVDVAEFGRMVPEKLDAFGRSARVVTHHAKTMQGAWMVEMQRFGAMMMSGKMLTPYDVSAFAAQATEYALSAISASAKLSAQMRLRRFIAPRPEMPGG